jgi:hypothetical protein
MRRKPDTLFLDIEVYWDFFYLGMKRLSDGVRHGIEMSTRNPFGADRRETVRNFLLQYQTVGFNSLGFDLPLIWLWIDGADNDTLKRASDRIIQGRVRWWEAEDALDIRIPWKIKDQHIDLIEPQPNPFASLKTLNGRLHGKQLQDLPFDPALVPSPQEMDILANYCLHSDLDATHNLWDAMGEAIELRRNVSAQIDKNVMSKSDTQMGLAIIKKRVEDKLGRRIKKPEPKPGQTFRYSPPDFIEFKTPQMRDILAHIKQHDFIVGENGKVDLPKWLKDAHIQLGYSTYSMGIGGLHSTESNRAVRSSSTHALCDFDVASYYPAIILNAGLYPEATGPAFIDVYADIRRERIAAKKVKDKVTDKSLKIALNGTFGSLGSRYAFVYAPHLMIHVTLTGQLCLLMLIEWAEEMGIDVVSGNTDGVVMRFDRDLWDGLDGDRPRPSPVADLIERWESVTGFTLEGTEYESIFNQSVNSYFAIKTDGSHKRKGPLGNPWSPDDFDPRSQMMKNPQMTICSDAALAKIKHGTPLEETIRSCRDIKQFVTVIKADGGATWNDEYLGKVVRYYWSVDGQPIFKAKATKTGAFPKVPKTEGARECMRLPDEFPDDIDYARYVAEADAILRDLGYYGEIQPDTKKVRTNKQNRRAVDAAWAVAP